jgi:hypothetical protein
MAHVQHAPADLTHHGKGLWHEVVDRFALGQPLAEFLGLRPQRVIAEGLDSRLKRIDLAHDRAQTLQFTIVLGADDLSEEGLDHLLVDNPDLLTRDIY